MATLTAFHKVGSNRDKPRIWLESSRLEKAGFPVGAPFRIVSAKGGPGLCIIPGEGRFVSKRRAAGKERPIIEISGNQIQDNFPGIDVVKARASWGRIEIRPSIRAASILRSRQRKETYRVFELFAGGGTLSDAISSAAHMQVIGGAELEAAYADIWEAKHPDAELFTGDMRLIHPAELPKFDILAAGIPCTSHSTLGRAKNKLAGKPETGETGDLFAWVLNIVAHRCPTACVFENVPSFGDSLAGQVLKTGLTHLGYHLEETLLAPHQEWGEPSDRKRWVLVATLHPGFKIEIPNHPAIQSLAGYLDQENEDQDRSDAERIAKTITGLRAHNARHAALGHGFAFTTINKDSCKVPTIPKSYHKINTGPFVDTPFGPRMLRLHEMEAIMGAIAGTDHYATGVQVIGQGVQTRIWRSIFSQLGEFLQNPEANQEKFPEAIFGNAENSRLEQIELFNDSRI
jgi:DNA (cytosine-5)-methyltransferase 1